MAWIRISSLEDFSRRIRNKRLKRKLFNVLKKNVLFREIFRQVMRMSMEHYSLKLLSKAWECFNVKKKEKIKLIKIKEAVERQVNRKLIT